MPRKTKKRVSRRKRGLFSYIKGQSAIMILVVILIIGGVLMAGGIMPKVNEKSLNFDDAEVTLETPTPDPERKNLQLQTLKFKRCTQSAAVDFLLDSSGSMGFGGGEKIKQLKSSVASFISKMGEGSVVGIRTFSESSQRLVPINFYKNNKGQVAGALARLVPNGGTYTKSAMEKSEGEIKKAVEDPKLKNYDFNLIFFSDGIPETLATNTSCPGGIGGEFCTNNPDRAGACRCYDQNQDPTPVAQRIKAIKSGTGKNVKIFSIVLFDPQRDSHFRNKLTTLMKNSATSIESFYFTTSEQDLKNIFASISNKVCN